MVTRGGLLVLLSALAACGGASAQSPLVMGTVTAPPGTAVSGSFDVPARAGDAGASIPFTVIRGTTAGPVLVLVAGTHGAEYVPIIALQRVAARSIAKTLRGTVLIVHVANMPSFLGRTIYYSPADGKNLNRVFPGKADGTLSERIAEVITREFIARATHVVDLHCGDGNESLRPYSYWITTGDPKVAEAGKAMALAFGLDRIVVDGARPADPAASLYLSNTAITRGKPAITTETGGMGGGRRPSLTLIERGRAPACMRHLGHARGPAPRGRDPVWIAPNEVLRAGASGIFYPRRRARQDASPKAPGSARITDFHGGRSEEIARRSTARSSTCWARRRSPRASRSRCSGERNRVRGSGFRCYVGRRCCEKQHGPPRYAPNVLVRHKQKEER